MIWCKCGWVPRPGKSPIRSLRMHLKMKHGWAKLWAVVTEWEEVLDETHAVRGK